MTERPLWGPFAFNHPTGDTAEYKAQLRSLASLTWCLVGPASSELVVTMRKAESSLDELELARIAFDRLPSLTQRRIISSWNSLNHWLPTTTAQLHSHK